MTSVQSAYYQSYQAIKAFFNAHPTQVAALPALATAVSNFNNVLAELDQAIVRQDTDTTGVTADKVAARQSLTTIAVAMGASLAAYAQSTGNNALENQASINKSTLDKMSEDAFTGRVTRIYQAAAANTAALANFGQTPATVTAFQNGITLWNTKMGQAEHATAEGETGTKEVKRKIDELNMLLSDTIDRLITVVAVSDISFGDEYAAVREINDAPTQTRALEVKVITGPQGLPVPNALAIINPGNIEKTTSELGAFYVGNLGQGAYTITVNKPGYVQHVAPFNVVNGETTILEVPLAED